MNKIMLLYKSELTRLWKYGITIASLVVVGIWVLTLRFAGVENMDTVFPLVLFLDSSVMALLLVGVTIIFETQENTFRSLMVSPVSKDQYLLAKSFATVTSSLTTMLLLFAYGVIFTNLGINIFAIAGAVMLTSFVYTQIGIVMTYYSRDFTDLLMNMFRFIIILAVPTILEVFNIIDYQWLKYVQYLNPTKNALILMQSTAISVDRADLTIAIVYMVVLAGLLFAVARRMFDSYVEKGGA